MDDQHLIHRIALSMLKGIGPVNARNLVAYCGGVDPLFTDKKVRKLAWRRYPASGKVLAASILRTARCCTPPKAELAYVRKQKLRMLFYLDAEYPKRLKNCDDAPVLLYRAWATPSSMWSAAWPSWARAPSEHGKRMCEDLVEGLAPRVAALGRERPGVW
jgi:DNA processing protein